MKQNFSLNSFIGGIAIGIVVSALAVGITAYIVLNSLRSGSWSDQQGIVRDIGEQVRKGVVEEKSTTVYGVLKKAEGGVIEIEAQRSLGPQTLTFSYDSSTQFVRLNNDDASTEVATNPSELPIGENVTIVTAEPTGSVSNQHAVKVVKF